MRPACETEAMIKGTGTDIVDVARIREKIDKEGGFRSYVFSPQEVEYCGRQAYPAEHYAARFAAKEALLKALGTGWTNGIAFHEISVEHDDKGKPVFRFYGETAVTLEQTGVNAWHLSIAHERDKALAFVILE
jgi:holo-[acyl-carrier protein] synthase